MNQCKLFCKFRCTHVKDNRKVCYLEVECFNAPDNHSNQEVNVNVISNVMTFLTSRIKVQAVHSSKRSYFFMNNGDNFIKFAGQLLNRSYIKCV